MYNKRHDMYNRNTLSKLNTTEFSAFVNYIYKNDRALFDDVLKDFGVSQDCIQVYKVSPVRKNAPKKYIKKGESYARWYMKEVKK